MEKQRYDFSKNYNTANYESRVIEMYELLFYKDLYDEESLEQANTILGYEFWNNENYFDIAEYFFIKAYNVKKGYKPACDLVALYSYAYQAKEALKWARLAIDIEPSTYGYLMNDKRIDSKKLSFYLKNIKNE